MLIKARAYMAHLLRRVNNDEKLLMQQTVPLRASIAEKVEDKGLISLVLMVGVDYDSWIGTNGTDLLFTWVGVCLFLCDVFSHCLMHFWACKILYKNQKPRGQQGWNRVVK